MLFPSLGWELAYNTDNPMELLLNLTWLVLSVFLGLLLVASRSRGEAASEKCSYKKSTAWVAYVILIALLLPAISMTDDLMAMAAPSDGEQIARRYDGPIFVQHPPAIMGAVCHPARDHSVDPLVCIDRVVALAAVRVSTLLPVRRAQGRAPPTVA